jgi:branched-chain amino acid transport system permease protein
MASLVAFLFLVPLLTRDRYLLHVLILSNVMATLAVSWNLVAGYLGQLNLAHAIFYGMGAYASGFTFKLFHLPPFIGILISAAIALISALVVGIPCFRLRGHYFAIATLAASQIFWAATGALSKVTGGEEGISGIKPLFRSLNANYYLFLILMVAVVITIYMILRSRLGLIIRSLHEDELLSEASGLNTMNSSY